MEDVRDGVSHADLFDEMMKCRCKLQMLAGIVQNPGLDISDEEIWEWSDSLGACIDRLKVLRHKIFNFHT